MMDIFKYSAASSAGFMVGIIPQLLIGVFILIGGLYLINLDKKKNKNNHGFEFYFGLVLIVIGSVVCFQIGLGLEMIMNQFN